MTGITRRLEQLERKIAPQAPDRLLWCGMDETPEQVTERYYAENFGGTERLLILRWQRPGE